MAKISTQIIKLHNQMEWLATNREILEENDVEIYGLNLDFYNPVDDKPAAVARMISLLAGKWEKSGGTDSDYIYLTNEVGFYFYFNKNNSASCVKVPTGRTVTRRVPVTTYEEVEEEEYEWDCGPVLSNLK